MACGIISSIHKRHLFLTLIVKQASGRLASIPLMIFWSKSKFNENLQCFFVYYNFGWSRDFSHVMTVILSWLVQNFFVICCAHFKPEHCKFWQNFELDRNTISGMCSRPACGAATAMAVHAPCNTFKFLHNTHNEHYMACPWGSDVCF